MNKSIIRFEKFCLKWAWLILSVVGLINLLFRITAMAIPSFGFAFFFFYKFAGGSLKEALNKASEEHFDDCVHGSNPKYRALDSYFFAFAMLIGTNFLILLLYFADRYDWF